MDPSMQGLHDHFHGIQLQQPGQPQQPQQPQQPRNAFAAPRATTRAKRPTHAYHTDLNQAPEPSSQERFAAQPPFDPRLAPNAAAHQSPTTPYVRPDIAARQIPDLPELREYDQGLWRTTPFCTWDHRLCPPSSQTDFTAIDQGNSSPKFARLSLPLVPAAADILEKSELPLALILQPLAQQRPEELPILSIDFGPEGPPRCGSCMSYISPFHTFANGGTQFYCPMCGAATQTRQSYFSPVDPSGRRVDMDQRPELRYGTVDFVAPKEYWAKNHAPKPIHWVIAIDVTSESVKKGIPEAAADAIRVALYGDQGGLPKGAKVAIITFDRSLHFYNLSVSVGLWSF
jgi:protein transport protein SEC24